MGLEAHPRQSVGFGLKLLDWHFQFGGTRQLQLVEDTECDALVDLIYKLIRYHPFPDVGSPHDRYYSGEHIARSGRAIERIGQRSKASAVEASMPFDYWLAFCRSLSGRSVTLNLENCAPFLSALVAFCHGWESTHLRSLVNPTQYSSSRQSLSLLILRASQHCQLFNYELRIKLVVQIVSEPVHCLLGEQITRGSDFATRAVR